MSRTSPACGGITEIIGRLGEKWTILVLLVLREGTQRFTGIKRLVPGISQRMLTLTLRSLERDGLVKRTDHATALPQVDYELTPLGHSLSVPLVALGDWARDHADMVRHARVAFDTR